MFDLIDGVMPALAKKVTEWKEDLFFAVKLSQQKLSKYYAEVTASTGMVVISAHILDSFRKLQSFRKWHKRMDTIPEDITSPATQYQEAFLKSMENEYCAKHRRVPVNKHQSGPKSNLIPSDTVLGSCQSSFDPYGLSCDGEEYSTPYNVAEMTPGQIDRAACLLMATRLYSKSLREAPQNWVADSSKSQWIPLRPNGD